MSSETVKEGDRCPKCRADSLTATEAEGGLCYDCQRNMREQKKVVDPLVQALLAMTRMRDAAIADCRVLAREVRAQRRASAATQAMADDGSISDKREYDDAMFWQGSAQQDTDASGALERHK